MTGFRVDQGNVLQAHAAALRGADRLRETIRVHGRDMRLEAMGGDPVSADAAIAFTHRLQGYVEFTRAYADELERLANALREAALTYGYTDDDIARGFPQQATSA